MLKRTTHITLLLLTALAVVVVAAALGATPHNPAPVTTPYNPSIDPADFGGPIDNPYLPLRPGTTFRYRGVGDDGKTRELNVVRVTRHKKRIMGIDAVVVLDKVYAGGRPEERTFDWYAQDKHGNVWYFGEDTKEYKNGKVANTEGSWEAGVDGAKPAIIMQAHPKVGESYRQEYYPGEAMDMAKVLSLDESATVAYGSFDHLLMTKDWNPLEPAAGVSHKYYAPGIGKLQEVYVEGPSERVELTEIKKE
jgi:hypothetical protein